MKKSRKIAFIFGLFFLCLCLVLFLGVLFYQNNLKSVSAVSKEIPFIVEKGDTYSSLSKKLENANLIKNEFVYKIYIKLNSPTSLQAGEYTLNQNMGVKEIISVLEKGSATNENVIRLTFKEGLTVRTTARFIAKNTNHTEQEFFNVMKDTNYIDSLIQKYWFLTDDIKNTKLYYPLEGYLYPNTYEFLNKDVSIKTIIETMLDSLEKKLEPYKKQIEASKYDVHEIMTLASMIQSEGNNISDFKKMASVFLTRLDKKMKLQSCASAYYGDKKIMGEDKFGDSYQKTNSYNTYVVSALPVGPISNPGIDAIDAVLNPSKTDYLYFASDKNMKVYFSKTYAEHQKTVAALKEAGNWYGS